MTSYRINTGSPEWHINGLQPMALALLEQHGINTAEIRVYGLSSRGYVAGIQSVFTSQRNISRYEDKAWPNKKVWPQLKALLGDVLEEEETDD